MVTGNMFALNTFSKSFCNSRFHGQIKVLHNVKFNLIVQKQYSIKPDYLYGAIKIICIIISWKDYKYLVN